MGSEAWDIALFQAVLLGLVSRVLPLEQGSGVFQLVVLVESVYPHFQPSLALLTLQTSSDV